MVNYFLNINYTLSHKQSVLSMYFYVNFNGGGLQ
jgi:hypothetical protein